MSAKCDRVSERLSSYLDRQLGAAERAAVEQHLEECRACHDELDRLMADRQVLRMADEPPLPPYLRTRVMAEIRNRAMARPAPRPVWTRMLAIAATVVVIAGSACAGVALGSSLARNEHRAHSDLLYRPLPQEGP